MLFVSAHTVKPENGGAAKDATTDAHSAPSSLTKDTLAAAPSHQWNATCASYKKLTVSFPQIDGEASYDLRPLVDNAPANGWTCKASENLFELEEYPPFFKVVFSILTGGGDNDKKMQQKPNELHTHQDKHVFFSFNPCKLLPHSCRGSRGRLFKFAAKLKKPHDPEEEINRLLAEILKPLQGDDSVDTTPVDDTEEPERAECLQNVLPTNTTFIYSHHHEHLQQHPDSNGLGGLWGRPSVSDDPTPWEPLDAKDPHKGLQSNFRHTHIFCPDSFMHTHIVLKCPSSSSSTGDSAAAKFDSCEHVSPCLFRMVLTTKAACPSAVTRKDAAAVTAAAATPAAAAVVASPLSPKADKVDNEPRKHQEAVGGGPAPPQRAVSDQSVAAPAASMQQMSSFVSGSQPSSSVTLNESQPASSEASTDASQWLQLSFLLLFGFRVALCVLIFAWMIYVVKDWTESKMQFAQLSQDRQDAAAAAASLNSYDSCAKALAGSAVSIAKDGSPSCELASFYTGPPTANPVEGDQAAPPVSKRKLRGIFSSPGRRFMSVWLPQTLDVAAQQAHAVAHAAQGVCSRVGSLFSGTEHQGQLAGAHTRMSGSGWDWTSAAAFEDFDEPATARESCGALGHCGYETI